MRGRAIIMPPLMLQWRPLHITISSKAKGVTFASLAAIASTAWAADAPLCPSQPTPPVAQSPTPTPGEPAASKEGKPEGAIDIQSDHATLGVDGNAALKGNVTVRQGDREIRSEEIQYNSKTNGFKTDSGLQYA